MRGLSVNFLRPILTLILSFWLFFVHGQSTQKYDRIVDSLKAIGQKEKLIPFFEKELKAHPNNETILRWLGFLYIESNQLDLGEKFYQDALTVNPNCAMCYLNIGRVYSLKKDNQQAMSYFDRAVNLDPKDARLYANRAQLKEFIGDKIAALVDYSKAIELDPKNPEYHIQRGLYNSKQNYFSLALSDLNQAVQLDSSHYHSYYQRSSLYYSKQMLNEALTDINKAIALDTTQHELYTGRGAIYLALKEHLKAIADNTKAIQLNPREYLPYYNRALAQYASENMDGYCVDIRACYAVVIKYEPSHPLKIELEHAVENYCDSTKASYYYQRGVAFYNLQQFEQAVAIYSEGLKKFPNNAMTLSFRGNAFFALKNYTKALNDYAASIQNKENLMDDIEVNKKHTQLTDEPIETYANGFISSMQISIAESKFALKHYDEALAELNKGIEMAPHLKEFGKENYYNVRGNIFLALGKYSLAWADFDKCIQINPSFSIAYINRAIAKVNLDNKVSMQSYAIRGGINNQSFNPNWRPPFNTSAKKSEAKLVAALLDCDKAIALDSKLDFAYYIRGQVKKLLADEAYCLDLLKAKDLGYGVEPELMSDCEHTKNTLPIKKKHQ